MDDVLLAISRGWTWGPKTPCVCEVRNLLGTSRSEQISLTRDLLYFLFWLWAAVAGNRVPGFFFPFLFFFQVYQETEFLNVCWVWIVSKGNVFIGQPLEIKALIHAITQYSWGRLPFLPLLIFLFDRVYLPVFFSLFCFPQSIRNPLARGWFVCLFFPFILRGKVACSSPPPTKGFLCWGILVAFEIHSYCTGRFLGTATT